MDSKPQKAGEIVLNHHCDMEDTYLYLCEG